MRGGLGRREVIGAMAALGAGLLAPMWAFAQSTPLTFVVQESGALSDWPLVVAALITYNAEDAEKRIEALRAPTGYTRPFKFSASDPKRIVLGKAMIDFFAREKMLRLSAEIVTNARNDWPRDAKQRDQRYFARYQDIVAGALPRAGEAAIRLPRQENKRSELLVEFLGKAAATATVAKEADAPSNLAQLAGLLAACIRADVVGTTDDERLDLLQYCKAALKIGSFAKLATDKLTVKEMAV
jgi:hypothetical protein